MSSAHIDVPITGWSGAAGDERPLPLRWLSTLGMNLVSYFAQAAGSSSSSASGRSSSDEASAVQPCNTDGHCTPVRCCCLACAEKECPYEGSKQNFTCPAGTRTFWTCREGTKVIGCGECAGGDSCFDAPWYCSIAFEIS